VLSLLHREDRSFTYEHTVVKVLDLNHPFPVSSTRFRTNRSHPRLAPDPANRGSNSEVASLLWGDLHRAVRCKPAGRVKPGR